MLKGCAWLLVLTISSTARLALRDATLVSLDYRSSGDGEGDAHGEETVCDMHDGGRVGAKNRDVVIKRVADRC